MDIKLNPIRCSHQGHNLAEQLLYFNAFELQRAGFKIGKAAKAAGQLGIDSQ